MNDQFQTKSENQESPTIQTKRALHPHVRAIRECERLEALIASLTASRDTHRKELASLRGRIAVIEKAVEQWRGGLPPSPVCGLGNVSPTETGGTEAGQVEQDWTTQTR